MTELWDIVNEKGEPTGVTWERSRHSELPDGMYHPCVEVWVRIGDKLLITRRHPDKSEPLLYDVPGGAVVAGENILAGAVRELSEEAGIFLPPEQFELIGTTTNGNVYAASYMVKLEDVPEITLQSSEVVGYKLVTKPELEKMIEELTRGTKRRYLLYKDVIF